MVTSMPPTEPHCAVTAGTTASSATALNVVEKTISGSLALRVYEERHTTSGNATAVLIRLAILEVDLF